MRSMIAIGMVAVIALAGCAAPEGSADDARAAAAPALPSAPTEPPAGAPQRGYVVTVVSALAESGRPRDADGYLVLEQGEMDRVRVQVFNRAGPLPESILRIHVGEGLRVIEGETTKDGTLPAEGWIVELVVEAVSAGRHDIEARFGRAGNVPETPDAWVAYSVG